MNAPTISLSGLKKKSASTSAKKQYPYLPDTTGEVAPLVDQLIQTKAQLDALEGSFKINGGELKSRVTDWYFEQFNGRTDLPSTVKVLGTEGKAVSVTLTSRYYPIDATVGDGEAEVPNPKLAALQRVMGAEAFAALFDEGFTITIDSAKIPQHAAQSFIESLVATCEMFGCEDAISARQFFKPKAAFHTERHLKFSAEQNASINKHLPPSVTLKAKGVVA
jgi:hypothetical protein